MTLITKAMLEKTADPPAIEMYMADGVFIKQMYCAKVGTVIGQHAHSYDHTSMVATGSVMLYEGELPQSVRNGKEYKAPVGILIKAGVKHTFIALEDGTTVYCIHNVDRTGIVDLAQEYSLGA